MSAPPLTDTAQRLHGASLLTPKVRALLHTLHTALGPARETLLDTRRQWRTALSNGPLPIATGAPDPAGAWTIDPVPGRLADRRVELLGGTDPEDLVHGSLSGAPAYIADLWNMSCTAPARVVRAHRALRLAAHGRLRANDGSRIETLGRTRLDLVPRPIHVDCGVEAGPGWSAAPPSAVLYDLCVFIAHNGPVLLERQGVISVHLRGVQRGVEAEWHARMLSLIEDALGLRSGSIRATLVLDSVSGALELETMLHALRHHAAGVALDPQGYAADHIALFHGADRKPLPDREGIRLNAPFLRSLSLTAIRIAHERGAHALGAPAFVTPPEAGERHLDGYLEMLADKEREAVDGHDGTIVGHPGLVKAAFAEFAKMMPGEHQIDLRRSDRSTAQDLTARPEGAITVESLVGMLRTVLRAFAHRQLGRPVVVQGGRSHDRSSVQLALALLWQWNHSPSGIITDTGLPIHAELVRFLVRKESTKLFQDATPALAAAGEQAAEHLLELVLGEAYPTLPEC